MKTIIYYLALSALFTHELDAVINFEWRLLFHIFSLPDAMASTIFIGLHLPLFFIFFYLSHHSNPRIQNTFRVIASIILVVHSVAHFSLSGHEKYYFEGFYSNLYIYSAAAFGVCFLILAWLGRLKET